MNDVPAAVLAFRYDDLSNGSPIDFERRMFERFRRLDLPLTAAAVPVGGSDRQVVVDPEAPLDEERSETLRSEVAAGWLEVAQHGFDHRPVGAGTEEQPSEFVGLPREEQLRRVEGGRDLLAERIGRTPVTFVPPWNRFDRTTVRILEQTGFELLSIGWSDCATGETPLRVLPGTCGLLHLEAALEEARRSDGRPAAVVALFHPYDFAAVDDELGWLTLDDLSAILESVAARDDVAVATLREAAELVPDLDGRRARAFARCHESRARTLLPRSWFGPDGYDVRALHDRRELERRSRSRWLRVAAVYGALLVVGLAIGLAAGGLGPVAGRDAAPFVAGGATLLAGAVTAYARRDGPVYHRGGMAIALSAGLAAGGWIALLVPGV